MSIDLSYWRGHVDGELADHERTIGNHDTRLGKLERSFWRLVGILTAVSTIASIAGGCVGLVVVHLITGK